MRATCIGGPAHYLGSDQTLNRMQRDYIYPVVANRSSPKEWEELGKPDLITQAKARKEALLAEGSQARLDAATDAAIRARFTIHLPA